MRKIYWIVEREQSASHEVSLSEAICSRRTKKVKLLQGVDGKRNTVHPEVKEIMISRVYRGAQKL